MPYAQHYWIIINIIITPHRNTYVDAIYYLLRMWPGLSVCLSAMIVSSAKTAEPIEMPFGLGTRVRNLAQGTMY